MEGLRTFLKVVICIILVPLILALTIVIQTKDVVENQFIVEAVKQVFENDFAELEDGSKVLDELTNTEGADEIIETIMAEYRKFSEDNTYQVSDQAAEVIINYCLENEATLKELSEDDDMNFEELKKPEAKEEIKSAINEAFRDINSEGDEDIATVISIYAQATSQENLIKCGAVILGGIVLIILLSWSTYKWMTAVGVVGIITGVLTMGFYAGLNAIASLIKENLGFEVNVKLLLMIGAVEFVLGLAFVITRSVLDGNAKKAKVEENVEPEIIKEPEAIVEPEVKAEVLPEPEEKDNGETESNENDEN